MPLVIACPSCNAKLKAPENLIGKTVKCPSCQSAIPVRAPTGGGAAPPPAKTAPAKAPARKPDPEPDDFDFEEADDRPAPKKGGAVKKSRDEDYDDDPDERPAPKKGGAVKKGRDDYSDEPPRKAKGRLKADDEFDDLEGEIDDFREDDDDDYDDDKPRKKAKKGRGRSGGGSTSEKDRNDAFMVYVAAFISSLIGFGPIGGIVWWLIKRGESRFVDHHGKEYLNLMITSFLVVLVCIILMVVGGVLGSATESGPVALIGIGLGVLLLVVWSMMQFVFFIIAMFKAKAGEWYLIPISLHLLKA